MWDMMRADQFLNDFVLNKDSNLNKTSESIRYYQEVLAVHRISAKEFQKSFSYYRSHPVLFRAIMDSLSQAPGEAPTQIVKPAIIMDSLQSIPGKSVPVDSGFKIKKRKVFN